MTTDPADKIHFSGSLTATGGFGHLLGHALAKKICWVLLEELYYPVIVTSLLALFLGLPGGKTAIFWPQKILLPLWKWNF
jgi:hypothetical protein